MTHLVGNSSPLTASMLPQPKPSHALCTRIIIAIALPILLLLEPLLCCFSIHLLSRAWSVVTGKVDTQEPVEELEVPATIPPSPTPIVAEINTQAPVEETARPTTPIPAVPPSISTNYTCSARILRGSGLLNINCDKTMTVEETVQNILATTKESGCYSNPSELLLIIHEAKRIASINFEGVLINTPRKNENFFNILNGKEIRITFMLP